MSRSPDGAVRQGAGAILYSHGHSSSAPRQHAYPYQGGQPVWTLESGEELALIAALCDRYAVPLLEATSRAESCVGPRAGRVETFQSELFESACFYAHLTGREARLAAAGAYSGDAAACDVIIATPDNLNPTLLDRLLQISRRQAHFPGLICAPRNQLRRVMLSKAFFAVGIGEQAFSSTEILPDLPLEEVVVDGWRHVLGRDAEPARIRHQLAQGRSVVTFATHSDGVDAILSDRAYLCDIRRDLGELRTGSRPWCHAEGRCRRLQLPIQDAAKSTRILGVEEIRARVIVWDTCWGLGRPRLGGAEYSVAVRLATSCDVGALITANGTVPRNFQLYQRLLLDLNRGLPLGTVIQRHNASPLSRLTDHKLFLLGDPRCSLQSAAPPAAPPVRRGAVPGQVGKSLSSQMLFLKSVVATLQAEPRGLSAGALSSFEEFDKKLAHGTPGPQWNEDLEAFQQWFLRLAAANPSLGWSGRLGAWASEDPSAALCSMCAGEAGVTRLMGYMDHPLVAPRLITKCPRCGISADQPAQGSVHVRRSVAGELRVCGEKWPRNSTGLVVIETYANEKRTEPWPREAGMLLRDFKPTISVAADVEKIWALVLDGLELAVFHSFN